MFRVVAGRGGRNGTWSERRECVVCGSDWPARLATAGLVATGLVDIVAIAFDRDRYSLLARIESGAYVTASEVNASDHRLAVIELVKISLYVVTAVVFIWWFRRAYSNIDGLGGRRRFGLGWAIGGWFVPVLFLWRPKELANDLWLTSDPDHPVERRSPAGISPLVHWWWGLFLVSTWIGNRAYNWGGSTAYDTTSTAFLEVSEALEIVAACLAVAVVLKLTSRQRQRAERRAALGPAALAELDEPGDTEAAPSRSRRVLSRVRPGQAADDDGGRNLHL